ncbi:hypothetical protein [Streptomyces cinereoruber]|uniref:hypothetical protein n=1 Tax=Streptomyces cinereoruber TaxID=67260 RepID=UPI003C2EB296
MTDATRLDRAETYAETVHRIYSDRRAAPPTREFLLVVAQTLDLAIAAAVEHYG